MITVDWRQWYLEFTIWLAVLYVIVVATVWTAACVKRLSTVARKRLEAMRRDRAECRLEAQSAQLKLSVLELARVLAAERDVISDSLLRAHFMTTGRLPDTKPERLS